MGEALWDPRRKASEFGWLDKMDLYDLWVSLNRPGAARFRDALKKRGIPARLEDVKSFTDQQVAKQLFAEPPKYRGHVISMGLDEKWAADVVINARGENFLLVQDVFSRYAWGVVLLSLIHI